MEIYTLDLPNGGQLWLEYNSIGVIRGATYHVGRNSPDAKDVARLIQLLNTYSIDDIKYINNQLFNIYSRLMPNREWRQWRFEMLLTIAQEQAHV